MDKLQPKVGTIIATPKEVAEALSRYPEFFKAAGRGGVEACDYLQDCDTYFVTRIDVEKSFNLPWTVVGVVPGFIEDKPAAKMPDIDLSELETHKALPHFTIFKEGEGVVDTFNDKQVALNEMSILGTGYVLYETQTVNVKIAENKTVLTCEDF